MRKIRGLFIILSILIITLSSSIALAVPPYQPTKPPGYNVTNPPQYNPPNNGNEKEDSGLFDSIVGIGKDIIALPGKVVGALIDGIADAFKKYYESELEIELKQIQFMLSGFKTVLTKDNINSAMFSFAKSLSYALKPIAYSLIGLFFIIDFTKKTIYFEVMNYINVVKPLIKLIITKYFVDNSIYIFGLILDITRDITYKVFDYVNVHNINTVMNYSAIKDESSLSSIGNTLFNTALWFFGKHLFMIGCIILIILCYVMANMRLIEIAFMCAVSPLFFATLAGDATNDVFRGFVKNFVSVAFQSVWMAVGFGFFATGYISGITGGASLSVIPNMLIGLITLTAYIIKAPSSVKSAIGGTGGGGVNLTSIVQLAAMAV